MLRLPALHPSSRRSLRQLDCAARVVGAPGPSRLPDAS